jgi:hypothetical protein
MGLVSSFIFLSKGIDQLQLASDPTINAHPARFFIPFFIIILIELALAILHAYIKKIRFENSIKTSQEKVAVETLSILGAPKKSRPDDLGVKKEKGDILLTK